MIFPTLGDRFPELAPVLDRLGEEHRKIAALLDALREVTASDESDPRLLLAEFDGLTAELEEHLAYEEEQLIPALDAVGV